MNLYSNSPSVSPCNSPCSVAHIVISQNPASTPKQRIITFVNEILDILLVLEPEDFTKIAHIAWSRAYDFSKRDQHGESRENPSLANCMNIIIKDRNSFNDTNKMFHFYDIMAFNFLEKSITVINETNDIPMINLNAKITESIEKFKDCI